MTAHLMMVPPATDEAADAIIAASLADPRRIAYGQRLRSTGELVGSWRDTVQFSMLAAEWPAVQQRLTARAAGDRPGGVGSVVEVRHEPESSRFVGFRDGRQVGLIDYRRQGNVLVVLHTEYAHLRA